MWNEIKTIDDLNFFLDVINKFHDSCLKELKYLSGSYVRDDLSMYPINDKRTLSIIFQRQAPKMSAIEVEFSGLLQLNLHPATEYYSSEITGATIEKTDNGFIWYDCEPLSQEEFITYNGTKIIADKVRWRIADEYIGQRIIYEKKAGDGSVS